MRGIDRLYIHVGMPKTGSTSLQTQVFPYVEGVRYVNTGAASELLQPDERRAALISDEGLTGWNRLFFPGTSWQHDQREIVANLHELYPGARILIGLRQQAGFVLSLYKQYLHEGGTLPLRDFFGPAGVVKAEDLYYSPLLEDLQARFGPLFVFTLNELRQPQALYSELEAFLGGRIRPLAGARASALNVGVKLYPGLLLRQFNRITRSQLNPCGPLNLNHPLLRRLGVDPRALCQRKLSRLPGPDFQWSREQTAWIQTMYRDDWNMAQRFAAERRKSYA